MQGFAVSGAKTATRCFICCSERSARAGRFESMSSKATKVIPIPGDVLRNNMDIDFEKSTIQPPSSGHVFHSPKEKIPEGKKNKRMPSSRLRSRESLSRRQGLGCVKIAPDTSRTDRPNVTPEPPFAGSSPSRAAADRCDRRATIVSDRSSMAREDIRAFAQSSRAFPLALRFLRIGMDQLQRKVVDV